MAHKRILKGFGLLSLRPVKKFHLLKKSTELNRRQELTNQNISRSMEHLTGILPPFPFCPQLLVQLAVVLQEVILPLL